MKSNYICNCKHYDFFNKNFLYWENRVVTSDEESIIKYIKHVFIFPLIEKMYLNVEPKNHVKKEQIVIGYHGNPHHLSHLHLGLKGALEKLSKEFNILLKYTTGNDHEWTVGKPNIPCEFKKWELDSILSTIQSFDIGIAPNISEAVQNNKMNCFRCSS